jgi:hypothetical protein
VLQAASQHAWAAKKENVAAGHCAFGLAVLGK